MSAMDCKINGTDVGTVLNYKHLPEAQKIISKALDGTVYGQKTGDAVSKYSVDLFCSTKYKRESIDLACANCTEIIMTLRDGLTNVTGIIEEETVNWKEWVDGSGVGKFTLVEV